MEGILEVNIGVDTVVLNAIKLTSDVWNWIVSLPYELVDAYVVSTAMLLHTGLSERNRRCPLRRLNSFHATS